MRGQMDTRSAASGTPSIQISPTRCPTRRPFTTVGVGKGSVPTSPTYSKQAWPAVMKRAMAASHLAPFVAYATPSSGAVDLWKKLAKKAELELHLERDSHRADNAKNNTTIHRLNRRLIPLDKALGKAKENLRQQGKLINYLKCQLIGADEKNNIEISYLRSQTDILQKRLAGVTQMSEQKLEDLEGSPVGMNTVQILELREELCQADSRAGTLQAQMNVIYSNVDEPPDIMDSSGTRVGSPASPQDKMGSIKNVQRPNTEEMGLVAVAKIHKMRLSKQQLKARLKDSEGQVMLLIQDNDRLRKLAQDAVSRSNKFLDVAQTLKADRDLTVSRLKETEDIINSLEALKDFVHSYAKTVSPRLGNFPPGFHFHKPAYKRQEAPAADDKNAEGDLQSQTAGFATTRAGLHTKVVYFKDDGGAGPRSGGLSLLMKFQEVFQVLACKVETANQTAKMVKKEREEIRIKMLEAFQELRGQKGSKLNTADDVALGVLIAVRDVKQTLEGLKKEQALLKASESLEDEKLMQLQSQVHDLSMDRLHLLETLQSVKNTIRASNMGQGVIQYLRGFLSKRVIQGENISEVLEMVEKLIAERNEARSMGGGLMDEKLLKEKELSDLRKSHAQSQTLATHLQVEKDLLKKERNELKATCEDLRRDKISRDAEKKGETDRKILELQSKLHDLVMDRTALLETLEAIKNAVGSSRSADAAAHNLKRSVSQGRNVSEVVEMVEGLVTEKDEAKQMGSHMVEEKEAKERELDEIRKLYVQSQSLCANLEEERKSLQHQFSELQKSAHVLKEEKESIVAFSGETEKELSELQTQVHDLTQDRAALRETLKTLRNIFRAADVGTAMQHSDDFLVGSLEGENISELLGMAEKLVSERNEARSGGRQYKEEKELKETELSDLRLIYSQSKSLCTSLQNEKDELEREVIDLQKTFRSIEGSISGGGSSMEPDSFDGKNRRKSSSVTLENMVNEVSSMKEKLHAARTEMAHDRNLIERIIQEIKCIVGKEEHRPPSDWESEISVLIPAVKLLKAEKEQLSAAFTDWRELHAVLEYQINKLFDIMNPRIGMENKNEKYNSSRSEPMSVQEHMTAGSELRKVVNDLPGMVEEVEKLKRENVKLMERLHSVELEKEVALSRSNEHEEKMLKLSNCSQQEVNELRAQLNSLQALVSSISVRMRLFQDGPSEDTSSKQGIKEDPLLEEFETIVQELLALRKGKADLEVLLGELRSKGASEQEKVQDLEKKLSLAEAQVQTLTAYALAADSSLHILENQHATVEAQLSELFGMLLSKDHVQSSSGTMSSTSYLQNTDMDIVEKIKAIKTQLLEIQSAKEEEVSKREKEVNFWKGQLEFLEREGRISTAEVERLRGKLTGQEEFLKKHTAEWTRLVENLKGEIVRLGGSDPKDEGEKLRKSTAAAKVKELVSAALLRNPPSSLPQTSTDSSAIYNPLLSVASFHVDLLVNKKVHSQLKVSGHNGGLCQAVLHYFNVDAGTGEITFENAMVPGSQSSNLVVDLFLLPVDGKKGYQTQQGDTLGLCVKVSAVNDASPREVLFNTNIVRTDEVMEAIHGQMIQNFSLWPDLMGSWRWERDTRKNRWSLVSVRWRFLLKNIFPELSAPLQDLTIKGGGPPRSSIHIL